MAWKNSYLDFILVPLALAFMVTYHAWLWYKVRTKPLSTIIGINAMGRKLWVSSIMKDNDKKNILAVQTLRNTIMGATLMATTSILLSTGLAAVISSTYSVKQPLNDSIFGAHGENMVTIKYTTLLSIFLFSFLCHSTSIRFFNQVNFLINCPPDTNDRIICPEYVFRLLEKGLALNTIGNRIFYTGLPILLWIVGPLFVFLYSLVMVPVLYSLDFIEVGTRRRIRVAGDNNDHDSVDEV